jgi:hypothetical protein
VRHTQEREIDGALWSVTEFSATEGLKILTTIARLSAGPLAQAARALGGSVLDAKVDLALVGTAVADLASRLDDDEVVGLAKRMLRGTFVDGKEVSPQFDLVFQGRYLTLFKVLGFVLEVNFKVPLADWLRSAAAAQSAPG